jgi:hypothetical protein
MNLLDQAIVVGSSVPFATLDDDPILRDLPSIFFSGEMLDWEAPTGGYLLTGCFATSQWKGWAVARYCKRNLKIFCCNSLFTEYKLKLSKRLFLSAASLK